MNKITIREADTSREVQHFWTELNTYHIRDICPEPDSEDREYFLGEEYRNHMDLLHSREHNKAHYLFFDRDGEEIGFAMAVIYDAEDGKCFLMEFCVYPRFRGNGTGKACAKKFLDWAAENRASYVEINCDTAQRTRFWESVGFRNNGRDEWGVPLMICGPKEQVPVSVDRLTDPEDWQLLKLMNGYLSEIGEECQSEDKQERLRAAIRAGEITFFAAKRGYRMVGMCSVSTAFSTFNCGKVAVFDDFYVEPVFRGQGIARMLVQAAMDWCREQRIGSLTVTCASCDEEMYRGLGFDLSLGRTYARITEQPD